MKKGFTLIELLAVIVILAIIAIIAVPIVLNIIEESKNSATLRSAEMYIEALEYSIVQVTLKEQNINEQTYNILESGNICLEYNDDNTKCEEELVVEANGEHPTEGIITIEDGIIKNIDIILSEKRIIKNDKGDIIYFPCTLISGETNVVGSKYECEVKPGTKYIFYVLSYEDDKTTNLIMDRNICEEGTQTTEGRTCLVAWNDETQINANGPVTAMTYLYNATKDWTNINPLTYEYNDREYQGMKNYGYTSFVSIDGVATIHALYELTTTIIGSEKDPLRARLPIYTDYSSFLANNEVASFNNNVYLFENLDNSSWAHDGSFKPKSNISGIYGYWTLSSNGGSLDDAWSVYYNGVVEGNPVNESNLLGVRPVINLKF